MAYCYTSDGTKLQKTFTDGSMVSNTYYVGGIQYSSTGGNTPVLDFIQSGEGKMINGGGIFTYQYDLKDNLGNVRATIDADPVDVTQQTARVIQENSYYAFGMVMPNAGINYVSGTKNNYLYNGKELQEELGTYDYGARMYDPAIGRWNGFDPVAERHFEQGAYNYVLNNPVRLMDLFGLTDYDPNKMTNDDWKKFDPKKDKFILNEVTISPGRDYDKEWAERMAKRDERDKAFMELLASFSGSNNGETGSYNWSKDASVLSRVNAYEAYGNLVNASGGVDRLIDGFINGPESDMISGSSMLGGVSVATDRIGKGLELDTQLARTSSELAELQGMSRIAKNTGRFLGIAGAGVTALESYQQHGRLTSGDYVKVGILVLTTFTPYGWVYGVIDIGVGLTTGTNLTDRIGNAIDNY